jgi:radical SAM superfamily enzyme YgiQ (UPF0313 family)
MIKLIYATQNETELVNYPPLSLLCLATNLKRNGFECEIIHNELSKINIKEIIKDNPMLVGISVMTSKHISISLDLSKKIKFLSPSTTIVWGGIYPSLEPKKCMKESSIDIVVKGEGEETIVDLAKVLKEKGNLHSVKGISFKHNGKIVSNGEREFISLDDYDVDYEITDLTKYILPLGNGKKVMSFITSRGCPYPCGFCYNTPFNNRKWRAYPVEKVIKTINHLVDKYNLDGIIFDDDNFFVDQNRAFAILENIKVPTYYLEVRVNLINPKFMDRLIRTKPEWIFLGMESGNDRILSLMKKGFTVKDITDAVKVISKYPINMKASFIVGYPGETWQEIRNTLRLALKVYRLHKKTAFMFCPFIPLPNTPSYQSAVDNGFLEPKNIIDWDKIDMLSKNLYWLNLTESQKEKLSYVREYGKLLDSTYLSGHSFILTGTRKIFSHLAYLRIKYLFFVLPFEPKFFTFMQDIYLKYKRKK